MNLSSIIRKLFGSTKSNSDRQAQRLRNSKRRLLLESLESRRVFAGFTPGNLLVYQVDAVSGSAMSPISLVEYTTSGTLVQTIPVASTGSQAMTLRSSTTEGSLSISADGQLVTFGGYRLDAGSATNPSTVGTPRVVGKVGPNGVVDTAQSFTDGYEGDSFRSVVTDDGSRFWLSGAGNGTTGGVRYLASPSATTTTSLTAASGANSRQVQVLNGNLYVSSGSNVPGRSVFQVGTGLPTSGDQTFTNLFPIGLQGAAQYNSYYFADLSPGVGYNGTPIDTMYTVDSNGALGAVSKWTYNGSNWFIQGEAAFANMISIVGSTSGSSVTLYGTTKNNGSNLVKLNDASGYNSTLVASWENLATAVVAAPAASFRGITRVPAITSTELSISPADAVKSEGNSGPTAFTFSVSRSGPVTGTSSATWTVSGAAPNPADGADFVGGSLPSGTVNFAIGELSKTITVNVNGDLTSEPTESFAVTLSAPVGATISTTSANGSILNDDASTEVSIVATDAIKPEGNVGSTPFTFTVTRSGVVAGITTTVDWAVAGTGVSPAIPFDFAGDVYPSGQLTFNPGETSKVITVQISGDTTVEPNETFRVTLSNITGTAAIITFTADGTILNDDSTFAVSPSLVSVGEGNAGTAPMVFTVTRTGDLLIASNIAWSVVGSGTFPASANDFAGGVLPSGIVSFAANEVTKTIVVNIQGDTTLESNETFLVTLDSATNGTIVTSTATGAILNDEFQALNAGDIVITSIYADNPDVFSFVPLVDLQPNTSIVFTDNAWNGTSLLTNEGTLTYIAPAGGLAKGTKVVVEYNSVAPEVNILVGGGIGVVLGNFGFSTDGDSVLAYVGLPNAPNFLFSVTTWGEYLTSGTPNANQTYLPPTLNVGSTAVGALGVIGPPADEVDNGQYNHANGTSGTPAQIRALVANRANWNTFNGDIIDPLLPVDNTSFVVTTPTGAPKVESVVFGDGTAQRSMVTIIKVNFDSDVTLDSNAFLLEASPIAGGAFAPVAFTVNQASALVSGRTIATLTFSGSGISGGSLADGNYRVTALSSKIRSTVGSIALDGDNNGSAGGDFVDGESATDNFFRLFGDSDGNGVMNPAETNRFRVTVGRSTGDPLFNALFDFDGNGSITPADTNQFRQRVGKTRAF